VLRLVTLSAVVGAVSLVLTLPSGSAAPRPLLTAIVSDNADFVSPDAGLAYERSHTAGARLLRISVGWDTVAPEGSTKPAAFHAADPRDPMYDFRELDARVRAAVAHHLEPIVGFYGAPRWAQGRPPHAMPYAGPYKPDPGEVGKFATALAVRYGGSFEGLPRVRYWRFWNEPNLGTYLSPQFDDAHQPVSPGWYRRMLEAFAEPVHAVHRDNVVIAGSLAPFGYKEANMAPREFLRLLLCLSKGRSPRPVCARAATFDAFALHPYTSGGPTHRASRPGDVSLGNLPEIQRLLSAGARYHRIRSTHAPELWVTEFSWDSRPPDPSELAPPVALQAQWTAEGLYRMWKAGVKVVAWFLLRDIDWPASVYQSGLYFRSGIKMALDEPKPTLRAFRFPFVTFPQGKRRYVWGRTPAGVPHRVLVEQRRAGSWKRLATVRSDRFGIFSAVLKRPVLQPRPPRPVPMRTSYPAAVLADQPTSYWRLGDVDGPAARDLVGKEPAVALGGVRFGIEGALRNDRDTAASFDGTGRIDLGPVTTPRTVELWAKTGEPREAPFFSNRSALAQFADVGTFLRWTQVFDDFRLNGGSPIADQRWHHIVYTYSGVTGRIYVDGKLDAENTWITVEGTAPASLGYDVPLGIHLKGSLDEVAIYDHPLSAAQVQRHYRASGRVLAPNADRGSLRARIVGSNDASLPFPLKPPPDRYVLPFGG